jgi:hypothetical protein
MAGRTPIDVIDIDELEDEVILLDQEQEHMEIRNYPCNCKDCLMWALIYGGAKVARNGEEWVPVMTDDNLIHAVTAADVKKAFSGLKTVEEVASAMSDLKIRAFKKDPPTSRISTGKKTSGKRKAQEDVNPNDPKDLFPTTPVRSEGGGAP